MRLATLLVVLACAPVPAGPPKSPAPPDDRERIVGVWTLASIETAGLSISGERVEQCHWALTGREYLSTSHAAPVAGTYALDPATTPKRIDTTPTTGPMKRRAFAGIYELDGDTLRVCLSDDGGPRPTGFPDTPAKGQSVAVYKRVKH
jgi:uncharacterized protein (TIGR03067 family)